MRVTCYDHYLHAYISTVGKKKPEADMLVGMLQLLVLVPFGAQFFLSLCKTDRHRPTWKVGRQQYFGGF